MRDAGLPTIINGVIEEANVEYVISLPSNYHKLMVQARTSVAVKLAFKVSESASKYVTLKAGSTYSDDNLHSNNSLYVQSETANTVIEVLVWSGGPDNA
jgi:hypothetical protein